MCDILPVCQLLIPSSWQFDLCSKVECTHHLFSTETVTSANTALMPSLPAAFWLRNQQQQLSYVGAGQTVGSGHTGATSTCANTAYPGCPVVTKHERKIYHPRGDCRITRPSRFTTKHTLAKTSDTDYQLSPTQQIVWRSETAPVVRVQSPPSYGSSSTVALRVSRNKQLFPPIPHAITLSVYRNTTQTFTVLCPALFFSRFCVLTHTRSMAAAQDTRTDDWASPWHVSPIRSPICWEHQG